MPVAEEDFVALPVLVNPKAFIPLLETHCPRSVVKYLSFAKALRQRQTYSRRADRGFRRSRIGLRMNGGGKETDARVALGLLNPKNVV